MTDRAVFGDFLHGARRHLGSPAVIRAAASRGGDAREISRSLLRVVIVMSRYVQEVSTVPRRVPSQARAELSTWDRAGLEARNALTSATRLLHGDTAARRHPDAAAGSELARRLDAASASLTTGRDLLETHMARAPSGARELRSEWGTVITSPAVARALLTELALIAHQVAPLGVSLDLSPHTRGSPEARRKLNAACEWLHIMETSIRTAHQREPVSVSDRELLHAIPVNAVPPRRLPDGSESVTSLCEGVIDAADRARHSAWASGAVPPRSPAITISSLRQVATASALTSHHCEILFRSLAARTAEDSEHDDLSAGLLHAAEAAGRASSRWLSVAHALDDVTTDTRRHISRAAAGASDLALWTGRLAYTDPQWTLASGPSHQARSPQRLAPEPNDVPCVVAAVHHACDAITRLACADREQMRAAAGADRILVATQAPPDIWDIPIPFVPAPPKRIDAILTLYEYTGTANTQATASAADAATAVRAPSRVLATARSATDARRHGSPGAAPNAAAEPPAAGQHSDLPGPVERILHGLGITSPDLLRRGAEMDRAAEQLIIDAAAERRPQHGLPSTAALSRSARSLSLVKHADTASDRDAAALPHGQASPHSEAREAEP